VQTPKDTRRPGVRPNSSCLSSLTTIPTASDRAGRIESRAAGQRGGLQTVLLVMARRFRGARLPRWEIFSGYTPNCIRPTGEVLSKLGRDDAAGLRADFRLGICRTDLACVDTSNHRIGAWAAAEDGGHLRLAAPIDPACKT